MFLLWEIFLQPHHENKCFEHSAQHSFQFPFRSWVFPFPCLFENSRTFWESCTELFMPRGCPARSFQLRTNRLVGRWEQNSPQYHFCCVRCFGRVLEGWGVFQGYKEAWGPSWLILSQPGPADQSTGSPRVWWQDWPSSFGACYLGAHRVGSEKVANGCFTPCAISRPWESLLCHYPSFRSPLEGIQELCLPQFCHPGKKLRIMYLIPKWVLDSIVYSSP